MSDVLTMLVVNTAIAAVLAIVAAVVWRTTGHAPTVRAILVVALVKLVLPPLVRLDAPPLSPSSRTVELADAAGPASVARFAEMLAPPASGASGVSNEPDLSTQSDASSGSGASSGSSASSASAASTLPAAWIDAVFVVWLLGSLLTLGVVLRRLARCHRLLAHATPAPDRVRALASEIAATLGLRRVPSIAVVAAELSPFVFGFARRPLVVLPEHLLGALTECELRAVLAHELSHVAHRDHLTRWLELAVLVVHWWNPLLFWIRRRLHDAEEMRCDARAVHATATSPRRYGRAILKTSLTLDARPAAIPIGASALGDAQTLKKRLLMITRHRLHHRLSWPSRLALALGTAALLPIGLRAQDQVKTRGDARQEARKADSSDAHEAHELGDALAEDIRRMVRQAVREALDSRGVRGFVGRTTDHGDDDDGGDTIDAEEIREKVRKAIEAHRGVDLDKVHAKVRKAIEAHRGVDLDKVHAKVRKAIEAHRGMDLDKVHAKVHKAMEAHGLDADEVHAKVHKALEAHGLDTDEIRSKVRKAMEARGLDTDEIRAKVRKALEAHGLDADEIHAKVRKALEAHGLDADEIHAKVRKAMEAHGLDRGDIREKMREPAEGGTGLRVRRPRVAHREVEDRGDGDRAGDAEEIEDLQRQIEELTRQLRRLERSLERRIR